MTMYNKTNPIRVGDTITVNGVPLTVVGAFSQGIFSDDVTIIAPETLFRRVAGEQNYNMIGVQLDRTASDETVLALAAFPVIRSLCRICGKATGRTVGLIMRHGSYCMDFLPLLAAFPC